MKTLLSFAHTPINPLYISLHVEHKSMRHFEEYSHSFSYNERELGLQLSSQINHT